MIDQKASTTGNKARMKVATNQRRVTTSSSTKDVLGCSKSESMKATKQKRKIIGKRPYDVGGQFLTSIQSQHPTIQGTQTNLHEKALGDFNSGQEQCQDSCGKIKLQLFPIDEVTRRRLEQDNHNPYLELTITTRKKISSVVKHLNNKWVSSNWLPGTLMLFPYNACLDSMANSRRWTLVDSDVTAADVHASVGSPPTFRLRYGWFFNLEQAPPGASSTPVHSNIVIPSDNRDENITNNDELLCSMSSRELGSCRKEDSANTGFQTPIKLEEVDHNIGGSANTSWVDCLSNMSFGAILHEISEAPAANLCHPLPAQSSCLQQISINCDSFDAAIASFMASHHPNNSSNRTPHSSILEGEETCHAFPVAKVTSTLKDPASSRFASVTLRCNDLVEQASIGNNCPIPASNLGIHGPEPKSGLQSQSQDKLREDINVHPEFQTEDLHGSNQLREMNFNLPDSLGPLDHSAPRAKDLGDEEVTGLGGMIATSMDAFQSFSIF